MKKLSFHIQQQRKTSQQFYPSNTAFSKQGASEKSAGTDLLVLLLQFLEENLSELLSDHSASTIRATFITLSVLIPQEQQQGTKLHDAKPL